MTTDVLNSQVLVLNRSWKPVQVTTARRALCLLFSDHANVVDSDYQTYDFESWKDLSEFLIEARKVSTPSCDLALPDVIVLTKYDKLPPKRVKFSRRNIYARDNYTCQYCGKMPARSELTIDHVIPRSKGGKSTWENVVLACGKCNLKKADKSAEEVGLKLQCKPGKPRWSVAEPFKVRKESVTVWQKFVDDVYWNASLEE